MSAGVEVSVEFESNGHVLRGVVHQPAQDPVAGLVFVHPFAEEKKCSHRVLVEAARAASDMGCAVLRFDLRGCGDSDGDFADATLDGWREDLRAALAYGRAELPCDKLGLLGLRLGGALAAELAETELDLVCPAVWEPVVDGARYLSLTMRRSMMRKKLTAHEGGDEAPEEEDEPGETEIDFDGYLVPAEVQAEISAIDLLAEPKAFPGPALVLNLSPRSKVAVPMEELASLYVSGEAQVVRQEPIWSTVGLVDPAATLSITSEWMRRALGIETPGLVEEPGS